MTTTEVETGVFIDALTVDQIFVDHTYQRGLDVTRARKIAHTWDRRLAGILEVSDRGADATPRYAVVDGMHRWAAAKSLLKPPALVANVHYGLTADDLRATGFVPERGVITAGWPCQDFSVAGRRAGLAGARSGLWWEVVRILADLRPAWFVGENVPGLLSSVCTPECPGGCMQTHGGAMGAVLGSLGELGYGYAYRTLDAQHFGVPQRRRRVFIVGHLGDPFGAAAQVLLEPEGGSGDSAASIEQGTRVAGIATGGTDLAGEERIDTHTHTRSPHCRAAGSAATGSTPNRQRAGISSSRREVVSALTTSYCGGIGGPDDNAAQAGYLVIEPTCVTGG